MGIDIYVLRFLLDATSKGGPFGDLLQIGHQGVHIYEQDQSLADALVKEHGIDKRFVELSGGEAYADTLFTSLGSTAVHAMDASSYEGAQIVHDLNDPIDWHHHCTYDTVLDGGSIEHIFNIPCALANMMSIVKVGGRLLMITAANNFLGHGLYQFSPEWAFRVFSEENGFKLDGVYVVPLDGVGHLDRVEDPAVLGHRMEIRHTAHSNYLMVSARKIKHVRPFSNWPQQSDYAAAWKNSENKD